MTVYVDNSQERYGRMVLCHMVADSVQELHEMADKIGIQRRWFENDRIPHYNICQSKRLKAIKNGAIEITSRGIIDRFSHSVKGE